jgi:hypothetical protein
MSEGLPNGNNLDQSLADDSAMLLHPGAATNNENSQTTLLEPLPKGTIAKQGKNNRKKASTTQAGAGAKRTRK